MTLRPLNKRDKKDRTKDYTHSELKSAVYWLIRALRKIDGMDWKHVPAAYAELLAKEAFHDIVWAE